MGMKEKLKSIKFVYVPVHFLKGIKTDLSTLSNMRALKKKKPIGKIRVAFLCQFIPAWNKSELVYQQLLKDDRFEVFLICVPSAINNNQLLEPDSLKNDTYDYFVEKGYPAINALIGINQWVDLEALGCDYVFYHRPYNAYMPLPYVTSEVSKYSRVCVLLYGMIMSEYEYRTILNTDFFKDVNIYFAETKPSAEKNKEKFRISHAMGVRKTCYYGMPALEQIIRDKDKKNTAWDFSDNEFRVMWTPRWTTDPALGGTNFFVYYKWLLEYAKENPDIALLMRPHPLAFDNFIRTGDMTAEEVEDYKNKIAAVKNISLDTEKEYNATIWNTSVLMSDYSGLIPEFFITGKPLIYCPSTTDENMTAQTLRMLEGCYIVRTPEELSACLEQLKSGNDRLCEKRKQLIEELFAPSLSGTAERIVEELANI